MDQVDKSLLVKSLKDVVQSSPQPLTRQRKPLGAKESLPVGNDKTTLPDG